MLAVDRGVVEGCHRIQISVLCMLAASGGSPTPYPASAAEQAEMQDEETEHASLHWIVVRPSELGQLSQALTESRSLFTLITSISTPRYPPACE